MHQFLFFIIFSFFLSFFMHRIIFILFMHRISISFRPSEQCSSRARHELRGKPSRLTEASSRQIEYYRLVASENSQSKPVFLPCTDDGSRFSQMTSVTEFACISPRDISSQHSASEADAGRGRWDGAPSILQNFMFESRMSVTYVRATTLFRTREV